MLQPGVSAARLLENLPPRPPTPPRGSDNARVRRGALALRRTLSNDLQTHTPSGTSQSSFSESLNLLADKSQKKVSWTEVEEYPTFPGRDLPHSEQPLRLLRPSAERKPIKSILKPYSGIIAVDRSAGIAFGPPHTYPNFAAMLESIVKQLAGDDRSSRLDAYMTLSGVLKAVENIPDLKALKEKTGLLMQFIQRDMSAKSASGALDTVLVNSALALLSALVWKPACSECLSTEFCCYVVDHAINSFEDSLVSKDVVKHLLFVIGQQTFSSKVMTSSRVSRIIEALNNIENRIKGRSIVLSRLTIYRKLLNQARISMLANPSWIRILFAEMTSSMKDVRTTAIAFGFEASLQLGAEKQISRAVMEIFGRDSDDGNFAAHYAKRLNSMIRSKQEGMSVPQIWSIVILFLRHHPQQLEHWEFMTLWLKIIQECFNKSDREIRLQSNLAWNRLVFAVYPDEKTAPTMIRILGQALSGQLKRKPIGKIAKEERNVAIGSVCNLLYYALRSNATAAQLDLYWDEYVVRLVGRMLVSPDQGFPTEQNDLTYACAIMAALFDTGPKAWINNRANETGMVQAEELPNIDPKWARKNVQRIFTVLEPLIEKCFTDLGNEKSPIFSVWKNFAASIASAGVKEVKVSNDTMIAVASIFNTFYKIWLKGPGHVVTTEKRDSTGFCTAFTALVIAVITSLGVLPFTEKHLLIDSEDTFTIVSSPSHHTLKTIGGVKPPLYHLFSFLARPPPGLKCDENYLRMVRDILFPFFETRRAQRSCIEFLNDLCQYIPLSAPASIIIWQALADFATVYIRENEESIVNSSGSYDQPLGVVYRNVVKILQFGVSISPNKLLSEWTDLFMAVSAQITLEAGEGSRSISIIEPLARVLQVGPLEPEKIPSLGYFSLLVSNAVFPRDRQSLDTIRRRLWGTTATGLTTSSFDPFLHLYTSLRQFLINSYRVLGSEHSENHAELLMNTADLVKRCPEDIIVNLLKNIQDGIVPWVLDEGLKYGSRKAPEVATSVVKLWANICFAIKQLPRTDTSLLRAIGPLLCSALSTKHKSTIRTTVAFWNSTFGGEVQLEYPPQVREALLGLRSTMALQLPSFPDSFEEVVSDGPTFQDSQEGGILEFPSDLEVSEFSVNQDPSLHLNTPPLPFPGRKSKSKVIEVPEPGLKSRRRNGTPEHVRCRATKKNITPKLEHDKSQIQSAPITPTTATFLGSQILTCHQKGVEERQRAETVTYRSESQASPMLKRKSSLSKLALASSLATVRLDGSDDPATPTTSVVDKGPFDDFIPSSPTPRRGDAAVLLPSSHLARPPTPELMGNYISSGQSLRSADITYGFSDVLPPAPREKVSFTSTDLGPSAQAVDHFVNMSDCDLSVESTAETNLRDRYLMLAVNRQSMSNTKENVIPLDRQDAQTSIETFVDAVSSLPSLSLIKEITTDEIHENAKSSQQKTFLAQESVSRQANQGPSIVPGQPQSSSSGPDLLHKSSYPTSDLDESSLLRLMTEFDDSVPELDAIIGAGAESQQLLNEAENNRNNMDSTHQYSAAMPQGNKSNYTEVQPSSDCIVVIPVDRVSQSLGTTPQNARTLRSSSRLKSNALLSSIPETPRDKLSAVTTGDSEELKCSLRIVDTDPEEGRAGKRTRSSSTPEQGRIAVAKKRKVAHENSEVPDSQEAKVADMPPSERRRNRPGKPHFPMIKKPCREVPVKLDMVIQNDEDATASDIPCDSYISSDMHETGPTEMVGEQETGGNPTTAGAREISAPLVPMSSRFKDILEALRSAVLRRDEVEQIENILWDVKGELYAAEKRGRQG